MALTTNIRVKVDANHTNALDLATTADVLAFNELIGLATGTGADQADLLFHDQRTITASNNEDLDLAGSLSDAFGATLTFVELKAIVVKAASGNTNNVDVSQPVSNGVPGVFVAAGDGVSIKPGGVFVWVAPVTGATVTAATGDLINFANSGAGTSVTYDVIFVGTSA